MRLQDRSAKFLVYIHESPDGKVYVGITSKGCTDRWRHNGIGYIENSHLYSAIQKYGWENFTHDIVAIDLCLEDACALEKKLIAEFQSNDPKFGYNQTDGGEFSSPNEAVREVLRQKSSARWNDPAFRKHMIAQLKGHPVSDETKLKISKANTGRKWPHSHPNKGGHLSEEHKAKLRGNTPWNKGLTKADHPGIAACSEKLTGRVRSDEWSKAISESRKAKFQAGYSCIWINNGVEEHTIESNTDIPEGYVVGRLHRNQVYMHKGDVSIKVTRSDIDAKLAEGYILGRSKAANQSVKKSLQKCRWFYEGNEFVNSEELAQYLRNHGYPRIVSSTVSTLYKKGFKTSKVYASLDGKITKENIR